MNLTHQRLRSLLLLAIFGTLIGCARESSNLQPMYGSRPKPPALERADEQFVETAVRAAGSREKAADHYLRRGWEAMSKQDWRTAMKRFNQAWLLTPQSADVLWGLGAACGLKRDYPCAIDLFSRAVELEPADPRILSDFAYTYINQAIERFTPRARRIELCNKAIDLLRVAATSPDAPDSTYFFWALALYHKAEYSEAWEKLGQAERLGGQSIDPRFIADLTRKMERPTAARR